MSTLETAQAAYARAVERRDKVSEERGRCLDGEETERSLQRLDEAHTDATEDLADAAVAYVAALEEARLWETVRGSYVVDMARALLEASCDNGGSFTCGEADAVASGLTALGQPDEAVAFLVTHGNAESEDEGDQHHGITEEQAREQLAVHIPS